MGTPARFPALTGLKSEILGRLKIQGVSGSASLWRNSQFGYQRWFPKDKATPDLLSPPLLSWSSVGSVPLHLPFPRLLLPEFLPTWICAATSLSLHVVLCNFPG